MPTATAAKTGYTGAVGGVAPAVLELSISAAPDADGGAERQAEVVRVGGDRARVLFHDESVANEGQQRLVERLHPVVAAIGDHLVDRGLELGVEDTVIDPPGREHQLDGGYTAEPVGPFEQALRHDAAKRTGDRGPHLVLLSGREHLDDPRDGLPHPTGGVIAEHSQRRAPAARSA